MVRPAHFGFNEMTAESNSFQHFDKNDQPKDVSEKARKEFDNMVSVLRSHDIDVQVIEDTKDPVKPDAVFPNNWISLHRNGTIVTYPMNAPNRRTERREDIIKLLEKENKVDKRYSFEYYEEEEMYLEGTGSMLLDRENNVVYACLSPRTNIMILDKFCILMNCKKVSFFSVDRQGEHIYHTNVMMALGIDFCVVCLQSISDDEERKMLVKSLEETGKEIIEIDYNQVESFAGNMLEVMSTSGKRILVMSETAFKSLTTEQINILESRTEILNIPIPTIEYYGGGSVRCMMAENFLPKKVQMKAV